MLPLQKDIQFFDHDAFFQLPRVWLSAGVQRAYEVDPNNYCEEAFIPQEPWRMPHVNELMLLQTAQPSSQPEASVSILRIPDTVFAGLHEIGLSNVTTRQEVQELVRHKDYRTALNQVLHYLTPFFLTREKITINPIITHPPGLQTVTFDYKRQRYVGLHLDGWDHLPLDKKHLATTRLCVNMGSEDRFLLFINLTIQNIYDILYRNNKEELLHRSAQRESVEKLFMKQYPYYPVVKLRIAPGEAYIGPTENMIHDASTVEQIGFDILLSIRGYLGIAH